MNIKKISLYLVLLAYISSCSLSPGMHLETNSTWLDDDQYVYIDSIDKQVLIRNIKDYPSKQEFTYKIGKGDQISVTIWGLPDIFPVTNISQDQNLRRVDSNGNIFFPYAGLIQARGKTQDELRNLLTESLGKYFNNPQIDVSISKYNSQQVFILGEVNKAKKINITDIPISLSDAIGESNGLNSNTASGSGVFVIRQSSNPTNPEIYYADLEAPSGFIDASRFFLTHNDIVFVNSNSTTRWNRVIAQFFPFSSFLASVDNLTTD